MTTRAAASSTSLNSGTTPAGVWSHSPRTAAWARATAADSGNAKQGIGATSGGAPLADMKIAATVLTGCASAARRIASATSSPRVTSGGMKITSTLSTPSSRSNAARARSYWVALADAIMSTGLPTDAAAGRNDRSSVTVASESAGSRRPFASQRIGRKNAGPPALVRIATRRPRGTG